MIQAPQLTDLLAELANSAPGPIALFERGISDPSWSNAAFQALEAAVVEQLTLELSRFENENSQTENAPWVIVPLTNPQRYAVYQAPSLAAQPETTSIAPATQIDHTTQLAARGELESVAERWMKERQQRPFGLLFIDLDDFKQVNDSQGHLAGDEQLRQVGQALSHSLRGDDFVARFGGDEFVALIAGDPTAAELEHLADRLRRTIQQHAHIGASIGHALSQDHATLAELLTAADRAMYADKNRRSSGEARL